MFFAGQPGTRRNNNPMKIGTVNRFPIIQEYHFRHAMMRLAEHFHQVIGKRIVIIENKNPEHPFFCKNTTISLDRKYQVVSIKYEEKNISFGAVETRHTLSVQYSGGFSFSSISYKAFSI